MAFNKISSRNLLIFTQQFSTLLKSKIPLLLALQILEKDQENLTFKAILRKLLLKLTRTELEFILTKIS